MPARRDSRLAGFLRHHTKPGDGEPAASQGDRRSHARQADPEGSRVGKLVSPARRRVCIEHVRQHLPVSERRVCAALGQHRSTQRKAPRGPDDEEALIADIIELARQYGRYGYRKIAVLLRDAGWLVNDKRVERIWRCEGLKMPAKQPKRGRLWLNDGSCVRLRPEHRDHVWSYDVGKRKLLSISEALPRQRWGFSRFSPSLAYLVLAQLRRVALPDITPALRRNVKRQITTACYQAHVTALHLASSPSRVHAAVPF